MDINVGRIIESIISSTIGGLFTIIGVLITIKYYRKKDEKDRMRHVFENRPNLVLVENSMNEPDLNILILPFQNQVVKDKVVNVSYDKIYQNKLKLNYLDYTFKNVGKTEISCVHFIMNQKTWGSIVEIDNTNSIFIENGYISHYVIYDKRVLPGEIMKVRIYHKKGKILTGLFSAMLNISLHDDRDIIWGQLFFYPHDTLYPSTFYDSIGDYREDILPKKLYKYFSDI